ncbi:hypothetical protein SESBI_28083 [Sesbania bispinosa]|nr:hypothetical protein SESBI_28083 [Sesbania bispinosa]
MSANPSRSVPSSSDPPPKPPDDGGTKQQERMSFPPKEPTLKPDGGQPPPVSSNQQGAQRGAGVTPNPSIDGSGNHVKTNLHGDWLLVTRNRKQPKLKEKIQKQKTVSGKPELAKSNRFESFKKDSGATEKVDKDKGEAVVFVGNQSESNGPIGPKVWTKKKRQRKEPSISPIKIVTGETYDKIFSKLNIPRPPQGQVEPINSATIKEPGAAVSNLQNESITILPNGFRTMMNVELVSNNCLRFVDEPKPSDMTTAQGKPLDDTSLSQLSSTNMDAMGAANSNGGDYEMVMDTYGAAP